MVNFFDSRNTGVSAAANGVGTAAAVKSAQAPRFAVTAARKDYSNANMRHVVLRGCVYFLRPREAIRTAPGAASDCNSASLALLATGATQAQELLDESPRDDESQPPICHPPRRHGFFMGAGTG